MHEPVPASNEIFSLSFLVKGDLAGKISLSKTKAVQVLRPRLFNNCLGSACSPQLCHTDCISQQQEDADLDLFGLVCIGSMLWVGIIPQVSPWARGERRHSEKSHSFPCPFSLLWPTGPGVKDCYTYSFPITFFPHISHSFPLTSSIKRVESSKASQKPREVFLHSSTSSEIPAQTEELAAAAPQAGKGTQKLLGFFVK